MSVNRFTVPGHSTRREFAVYVVVARKPISDEFFIYVGKTGDNREGCNPVISRAGNHFSYNKIHSQVRNKIGEKKYRRTTLIRLRILLRHLRFLLW